MNNPIIRLKEISFCYGAEGHQLKDISLDIAEGECVLMTGPSGCGKTTLTRLLNGLIPHYYDGELSGSFYLKEKNVKNLEVWEYGELIGSIFQDARSQFFTSNVLDELAFASENYCLDLQLINSRVNRVLEVNQIAYLKEQKLDRLSSGEKQKIAMSAVEVHGPELFVLDEPSANLDHQGSLQLTKALHKLKKEGKTIIVADHRICYLMDVVDRIIYMADGKLIQQWSREEFQQLSKETLDNLGIREKQEIIITEILKKQDKENIEKSPFLELSDVAIGHHRFSPKLLSNISLQLNKGDILLLTGKNGLGKTTLVRTLCGLNHERGGQIFIDGKQSAMKKRREKCWFVLQDADYQLFSDSVLNELLLGIKHDAANLKKAEKLLNDLGLLEVREQHPATLSGGQKQRLVFAVGLMREPELLILDEPTSGLDAGNMLRVQQMILDYAKQGLSFLIVTHDFEFARGFGQRTIQLMGN
ncbi:ABC transporter ATP-binding protein [Enterococcus sp. BWT-B8]|uniref:ABC transporter ATP-binding protein n=1 Tax=Enterococcus sp. BWT-B8 TaxID=2885157 RepID=UPI001E552EF2|nr:ABC transporter ATP-binding protein [Enterococcus sp. BWT-B8]MCB5950920.1 ABC transporter ATP-binding protein [Enterococcus sp. BWT-B8]